MIKKICFYCGVTMWLLATIVAFGHVGRVHDTSILEVMCMGIGLMLIGIGWKIFEEVTYRTKN